MSALLAALLVAGLAAPPQASRYAIIVANNHPSGSITPSDADKRFTKSLMMAAQATGISFVDHIIIGDNRYFSFADEGLIGEYKAVAISEL